MLFIIDLMIPHNGMNSIKDLIKITFAINIRGKVQTFPCIVGTYLLSQ